MITFTAHGSTKMASWRLRRSGCLFTVVHSDAGWFLGWNGPLFSPDEVKEQPRLLGEFREAKGRFLGDERPEVGAFYTEFETILEGAQ